MDRCGKLAQLLSNEEVRDSNTFPRHLESLRISSCDELTSLSDEFLFHLSSLKKLEIGECKNLIGASSLSSSSTGIRGERGLQLQYLTTLESLVIDCCEKLICDDPLELHPSPCLKELRLQQCPNLRSLSEELRCFTALRELKITSCENLVALPDGLGCLTTLKMLEITKCTGITALPEWLGCLSNLRGLSIGLNSLLSLPQSLGCLTNLTILTIQDIAWTSLPDCLGRLTALKSLTISHCVELTSLPEGLEGLTRVEQLEIANCPKLVSLPESLQRQLPGLQWIRIVGCPILERKCATGGEYWRLVSHIPRRAIGSLSSSDENNQRVLGSCNSRSILCCSS